MKQKTYKSLSTELMAIKRMVSTGRLDPELRNSTIYDLEFSKQFFSSLEEGSRNIDSHLDILYILQHYKQFILDYLAENRHVAVRKQLTYVEPVKLDVGIQLIYGPPDSLKSTIARHIANSAAREGLVVLYVDAENHYSGLRHLFSDSVHYVPGTHQTHHFVSKVMKQNMADIVIIDTIFALTKWVETTKTIIKTAKFNGQYVLLVDQERSDLIHDRFEPVPATGNITTTACNHVYYFTPMVEKGEYYVTTCQGKEIKVSKSTLLVT